MTQITGVGFSNFRVFKNKTFFDLAPVSIFTGTNSSGKSSVFKAIKLLNNNAADPGDLRFSGEGHKLGTFNFSKSRNSESNTISLMMEFGKKYRVITDYVASNAGNGENGFWNKFLVTVSTGVKIKNEQDELFLKVEGVPGEPYMAVYINLNHVYQNLLVDKEKLESAESSKMDINKMFYQSSLEKWDGTVISFNLLDELEPVISNDDADYIRDKFAKVPNEKIFDMFSVKYIESIKNNGLDARDKQLLEYLREILEDPQLLYGVKFEHSNFKSLDQKVQNIMINSFSLGHFINEDFRELINIYIKEQLSDILISYQGALNQVHYIESIRANSQRLYTNQSQGTAFNELLLGLDKFWSKEDKREMNNMLSFADEWLKKFGIGDKVIINRVKGIATEIIIEKDGYKVDLIDLGYGVTQFLPILLYICSTLALKDEHLLIGVNSLFNDDPEAVEYKPKKIDLPDLEGPLLLIEEPESNLHPKLQSLLADFFVDVAQTFKVTLLIETHSEYLIRRLQVLTAAGEVKPEHSVIYYLDGTVLSDSNKFVRKININYDGSLSNDFGPGFIDEATNWKMELMRLRNAHLYNAN